jgi:hypothetical protein
MVEAEQEQQPDAGGNYRTVGCRKESSNFEIRLIVAAFIGREHAYWS